MKNEIVFVVWTPTRSFFSGAPQPVRGAKGPIVMALRHGHCASLTQLRCFLAPFADARLDIKVLNGSYEGQDRLKWHKAATTVQKQNRQRRKRS